MDNVIIAVIAWVIVYPLLFVVAILVWRFAYLRRKKAKDDQERKKALARIESERERIRERLKT